MGLVYTCEKGEAMLGETRVLRKHWRAGRAKFLAANIVTGPRDQRQTTQGWRGEYMEDGKERKKKGGGLLVREVREGSSGQS